VRENGILRVVARFLIPLILLFALYVQFHGEYSPGGGFQAGVLFAAGWILFVLVYGLETALRVIPARVMYVLACVGVLLYSLVGLAGVALGGHFLDFYPLLTDPHAAQQAGIVLVELGVGITVASVIMLVFALFAGRRDWWSEVDAGVEEEER
jgi:multicomponent Na+:H+ antiporter subunit B